MQWTEQKNPLAKHKNYSMRKGIGRLKYLQASWCLNEEYPKFTARTEALLSFTRVIEVHIVVVGAQLAIASASSGFHVVGTAVIVGTDVMRCDAAT
jgi:hypothetical protein